MPRQKSVRTIVAEVVMYVGMIAVVGQIVANFWEKFMIQSELAYMKASLYSLKYTVNNIGTAYDQLHKELKNMVTTTGRKASSIKTATPPPVQYNNKLPRDDYYKYIPEEETEVRSVMQTTAGLDVSTTFGKRMRDFMQECKLPFCKNVSTLTRYPLRSTAVGQDKEHERPGKFYCHVHRYYDRKKNGGKFKTVF